MLNHGFSSSRGVGAMLMAHERRLQTRVKKCEKFSAFHTINFILSDTRDAAWKLFLFSLLAFACVRFITTAALNFAAKNQMLSAVDVTLRGAQLVKFQTEN